MRNTEQYQIRNEVKDVNKRNTPFDQNLKKNKHAFTNQVA